MLYNNSQSPRVCIRVTIQDESSSIFRKSLYRLLLDVSSRAQIPDGRSWKYLLFPGHFSPKLIEVSPSADRGETKPLNQWGNACTLPRELRAEQLNSLTISQGHAVENSSLINTAHRCGVVLSACLPLSRTNQRTPSMATEGRLSKVNSEPCLPIPPTSRTCLSEVARNVQSSRNSAKLASNAYPAPVCRCPFEPHR